MVTAIYKLCYYDKLNIVFNLYCTIHTLMIPPVLILHVCGSTVISLIREALFNPTLSRIIESLVCLVSQSTEAN